MACTVANRLGYPNGKCRPSQLLSFRFSSLAHHRKICPGRLNRVTTSTSILLKTGASIHRLQQLDSRYMSQFVHLHLHTDYSMLDGACESRNSVNRVKELGMPAVAMTDHGNIFGAVQFVDAAKEVGVKPIVGCELYICKKDDHRAARPKATATTICSSWPRAKKVIAT